MPSTVFAGSLGQASRQFAVPSPSLSVSGVLQPHTPGAIFGALFGHASAQFGVPSASLSAPGKTQLSCTRPPTQLVEPLPVQVPEPQLVASDT